MVLPILEQIFCWEEAGLGQGGIDCHASVPLAQDEAVSLRRDRPLRVEAEHLSIEHRDDVANREG